MAASKQQLNVVLIGKLSALPALSLALLTGFSFSFILPSALQTLLPVMESLFCVSLPHLWQASLSWFTPPCLFLLLNGIIVILTATSGSLSQPVSSQSPTYLPAKMEKFCSRDADLASTELPSVGAPQIEYDSADVPTAGTDTISPPELQIDGPIVSLSVVPLCYDCLHAQDAAVEELELPKEGICHDDFNSVSNDDDDDTIKEMQIIPLEEPRRMVKVADRLDINDGPRQMVKVADRLDINDGSDDPTISSCEEVLKAGSEPSTPTYASATKDNARSRSLSIDFAPYIDNIEDSPEYKLSEEAFKKRIEDYIFKVNAKLRSETRFL